MTESLAEPASGTGGQCIPYPNPLWACLISIALAVTLSASILIFPRAVATSISGVNHGLLSLLLWGAAAGFVHGVGFVPRLPVWRILFHPLLGWPVMLYGILTLSGML